MDDARYHQEKIAPLTLKTAMEEASRCLLCVDTPCSIGCPAKTDPAKFIRSIRFRNIKGAIETIRSNNVMAASCAYICPYDKLCEKNCTRGKIDRPISIGQLQRFAIEQEKIFNMYPLGERCQPIGKKVVCIGAGPASLAVASSLAQKGVDVTIYESESQAGGVLRYGITPSRLPDKVINQDIIHLEKLGVKFIFNTTVGKDISLLKLHKKYDAIFVGIGLCGGKNLNIKGETLLGVENALSYLKKARKTSEDFIRGDRVIVIGGGDVAIDCATTAKLLGAKSVSIYYRRSLNEAPANITELHSTIDLGISISTEMRPFEILGDGERVTHVLFKGSNDDTEAKIHTDKVILAIGQIAVQLPEFDDLKLNEQGLLDTDNSGMTKSKGIFSAGDIVNGGKTVVEAVAEGKKVATNILHYLNVCLEG